MQKLLYKLEKNKRSVGYPNLTDEEISIRPDDTLKTKNKHCHHIILFANLYTLQLDVHKKIMEQFLLR